MRNRLFPIMLVALLITLLTTGAGLASPAQGPETPSYNVVQLSQAENGGKIHLSENDLLVIELDANPSTGYSWEVAEMDGKILAQVEGSQIDMGKGAQRLGAPVKQLLRFHGLAQGLTHLNLVYHRPWETDLAPLATFSVDVETDGAFKGNFVPEPVVVAPVVEEVSDPALAALPTHYNVCENGGCTPVKNQGNCGSCWAFGTVGVMEARIKMYSGTTRDISEQYLVSCNNQGYGCDGGWFAHDYHISRIPAGEPAAGAVYEAAFPYKAADVACNPPHVHNEKLRSWRYVKNSSSVPTAAAIKQAIYTYGPVAAAVCVGNAFQNYTTGIFKTNECTSVNHAIILVGWDDTQGVWYLRNSWGSTWGESGYMRIKYGTSAVGYGANYVTYP